MNKIGWVEGKTEIYNGEIWKPIEDYVEGEQIMVYDDETHSVKLEVPIEYNAEDWQTFWKFWGDNFLECISSDSSIYDKGNSRCENLVTLLSNPLYKEWYENYKGTKNDWILAAKLCLQGAKLLGEQSFEPYDPDNKRLVAIENGKKYNFVTSTGLFITRRGGKITISLGEKYAE